MFQYQYFCHHKIISAFSCMKCGCTVLSIFRLKIEYVPNDQRVTEQLLPGFSAINHGESAKFLHRHKAISRSIVLAPVFRYKLSRVAGLKNDIHWTGIVWRYLLLHIVILCETFYWVQKRVIDFGKVSVIVIMRVSIENAHAMINELKNTFVMF